MPDVAALNVVISADTKDLEAGLARAEQSVSKAGSAIQSAMGGALIAGAAGLGAALVGSVKSAADFEKGLSAISAVSGATKEQLEGIRATALQLGKDTSFSASEAAAGMEEMVKAGVSLQDVMGGAGRAALDLAAAGGLSVAESATIASNAMNVFSLKGSDMAHVADVIAGAANASAIDVHDFGFSLSAVGAVAATVGLGLEDTATAIAVLGQAGLKGSDAGTSLKTMLLNLDPASKPARSAMKALGIITAEGANQFFDAEGKAKSLADISGILQNALKGLTKEQQLSALQTMFGTDAIRAAAIMAKAGSEGFNEMAENMSKVTAKAVAMERLNNVAGSFETLKGSVETAAIMLGSLFLPAIKGALDGVTEFVNQGIGIIEQLPDAWRTAGEAFAGAWEPSETLSPFINLVGQAALMLRDTFGPAIATAGAILQQLSTWFTENIAPIAAFVAGFLGAIGTVGLFTAAIAAVTAVLTLLLSPIGLVAIAVGLLAAAWTTNFMGIQEATAAAWAYLLPIFTQIVDWLGPKISAVLTWLTSTGWPMMLAAAQTVGNWIMTVALPALAQLVDWLGPKLSAVVTWITNTGWPALVAAAMTVTNWITTVAVPAFTTLVQWIGEKTSAVVTWLTSTGWPGLVAAGEKVWAVVREIQRFFQLLYIELDKREVFATLAKLWDTLTAAGLLVWDIIKKMDAAFRPFQQITAEFNAGPGKVLVGTFGLIGTSGAEAGKGVDVVAKAAEAMGRALEIALFPLKNFLQNLKDLGELIEKAKSWTLPSWLGGGGSGGIGTMSYKGVGSANPNASDAEIDDYIRQAGRARGMSAGDIEKMVKTSQGERAGQGTRALGDGGTSHGVMQLHTGGGLGDDAIKAGIDITDPATWKQQVEFALDRAITEGFGHWTVARNLGYTGKASGAPKGVSVAVPNAGIGDIKISQAQWGASVGMTPAEAAAACGPYAASIFAQATGRMPNAAEAEQLARAAGWTEAGMGGTGNFMRLLGSMGVNAVRTATGGMSAADITQMASNAGPLTAFSTPGHYFASTGFDPTNGKFNVGATGTFAGGSTWMTVSEMSALMGPIQDIITLGGQMGSAFNDASAITVHASEAMATGVTSSGTAFSATAQTAQESALTLMSSQTDALGNVMSVYATASGDIIRTTTAANGQVISQYATMASGATLEMGNLAAGVTSTQTTMGANLLTTVTDMSGQYVTTVTDLGGQIVAQFAGTSAGVLASTAAQSAGVLTQYNLMGTGAVAQVTDMGEQTITKLTETSGLATTTVTTMGGAILSQMVTLKDGTVVQMDDMGVKTTTAFDTMHQTTTTTMTTMSGEVITTVTDMNGKIVAQTIDTKTKVSQEWVATSTEVIKQASAMGLEVIGQSRKMGEGLVTATKTSTGEMVSIVTNAKNEVVAQFKDIVTEGKTVATGLDAAKKGLDNYANGLKGVGNAAKKAADQLEEFNKQAGGGKAKEFAKGTKSSGDFGKAAGGSVNAGQLYMVGERGPELFMSGTGGTIIPNHMLSSGGGMQTIRLQVEVGGRVAEEIYVTGKDLAARRGRD